MKRKLSFQALSLMDGQEVEVHDDAYNAYNQICTVKISYVPLIGIKNKKQIMTIQKIELLNEEFLFEYDSKGNCVNGEFSVYSKD